MLKNTSSEYGSVAKFIHWFVFLLVLGMLFAGYFMGGITDKPLRGEVVNIHKLVGLVILLLMLFRVLWTVINIKPSLPPGIQRVMAHAMHYLLYAVLIIMPLSGWVMSSASGHPPHVGDLKLPLPVPQNEALDNSAFSVHSWVAIAIIALVSLHAIAALYHHFIHKDDILKRMWPRK